jgi:hypothetical protein
LLGGICSVAAHPGARVGFVALGPRPAPTTTAHARPGRRPLAAMATVMHASVWSCGTQTSMWIRLRWGAARPSAGTEHGRGRAGRSGPHRAVAAIVGASTARQNGIISGPTSASIVTCTAAQRMCRRGRPVHAPPPRSAGQLDVALQSRHGRFLLVGCRSRSCRVVDGSWAGRPGWRERQENAPLGDQAGEDRQPVRGQPVHQGGQGSLAGRDLGEGQGAGEAGFDEAQSAGSDRDHPEDQCGRERD